MVRAFLALLLACAAARADVPLKARHHVPNGVPGDAAGYCQWASWETLGNCLKLPALKGLKARRARHKREPASRFVPTGGWHWEAGQAVWNGYWEERRVSPGPAHTADVVEYLEKLGVKAVARYGRPDVEYLQRLSDRGVGAVAQVLDLPGIGGAHVVYVIGCTRDKKVCYNRYTRRECEPERLVTFYDCNYPGQTFTVEYSWFARYWDGTAAHLAPATSPVPGMVP